MLMHGVILFQQKIWLQVKFYKILISQYTNPSQLNLKVRIDYPELKCQNLFLEFGKFPRHLLQQILTNTSVLSAVWLWHGHTKHYATSKTIAYRWSILMCPDRPLEDYFFQFKWVGFIRIITPGHRNYNNIKIQK